MMAVRMPARAPVLRRQLSASVMHQVDVASAQRLEQQDERKQDTRVRRRHGRILAREVAWSYRPASGIDIVIRRHPGA